MSQPNPRNSLVPLCPSRLSVRRARRPRSTRSKNSSTTSVGLITFEKVRLFDNEPGEPVNVCENDQANSHFLCVFAIHMVYVRAASCGPERERRSADSGAADL